MEKLHTSRQWVLFNPAQRIQRILAAAMGAVLMLPATAQAGFPFPTSERYFRLGAIYTHATLPRIGGGTYFNPALSTEVALGLSRKAVVGWGFGMDLSWWSDEELWAAMDSLESMAAGSYGSTGMVAPSIEGSLDALYEEDDLRDEESWGPATKHGFSLHFSQQFLDGHSYAMEPFGGNNVASTYFRPDPVSLSTGVFLGASGEDVMIHTDFRDYKLRTGFDALRGSLDSGYIKSSLRATLRYMSQDHSVDVTSPSFTPSQFSSRANYDTDEYRFTVGYGLLRNYLVTDKLSMTVGGGFDLGYRRAKLKAMQDNRCSLCGGSQTSLQFTEKRTDSGVAFDLDLNVGAYYKVAANTQLGVTLQAAYSPDIAKIETKDNPNESLNLKSDDYHSWGAQFGFRHAF
jgi:hypothetical protein